MDVCFSSVYEVAMRLTDLESHRSFRLWQVGPLLDNDLETGIQLPFLSNGSVNKHVSTATRKQGINGRDVSVMYVPRCYKQESAGLSEPVCRCTSTAALRKKGNPVPGGITAPPCSWGI
jgi:hypothetical protein